MFGLIITVTGVYYSSYALINAMNKTNLKPHYYNYNTFYTHNKSLSSSFLYPNGQNSTKFN